MAAIAKEAEAKEAAFGLDDPSLNAATFSASSSVKPQAIFDATFAGQQFGTGRSEELGVLRELRDSNNKIADRVKPGIAVS